MEEILTDYQTTDFFNISINSKIPHFNVHMSQWAATLDKLAFEQNKLFIVSAGNVPITGTHIRGVRELLHAGFNYPDFLFEPECKITDPAHSCFSLTVGSVCLDEFNDVTHQSFGLRNMPSSFSRTGFGMWGMIKPEVVEYGGDLVFEKNTSFPNIAVREKISPELVKSGTNAVGRDQVGTSFSAPKVMHIVAHLKKNYPSETSLMYKTLIVQSARLPFDYFKNPTLKSIQHYGYGIPELNRAIQNNSKRITFVANYSLEYNHADVFKIQIPKSVNRPGLEYEVLVEVTVSYLAKPRRTRRRTQSYLSSWMEWKSSKKGEKYERFCQRVTKNLAATINSETNNNDDNDNEGFNWIIGERKNTGIENLRRNDSSTQKDWMIISSNQLPEEFSLAVIARKGWETKPDEVCPYTLAISFEILDNEVEIDIYNEMRIANQIPIPVNIELS